MVEHVIEVVERLAIRVANRQRPGVFVSAIKLRCAIAGEIGLIDAAAALPPEGRYGKIRSGRLADRTR